MISRFRIIKVNKIVNKFLLEGDNFMPEMNLKQSGNLALLIVFVDHLLKIKKEFKSLKKPEIQNIFIEIN